MLQSEKSGETVSIPELLQQVCCPSISHKGGAGSINTSPKSNYLA
jgi:hypothetical protein